MKDWKLPKELHLEGNDILPDVALKFSCPPQLASGVGRRATFSRPDSMGIENK